MHSIISNKYTRTHIVQLTRTKKKRENIYFSIIISGQFGMFWADNGQRTTDSGQATSLYRLYTIQSLMIMDTLEWPKNKNGNEIHC